ncbi:S8 family serine peptidase [Dactylosporangium sp. CA-092794]|uniref:S8 family serine peptidase n=1 Tax=Dactylosporangium sp. CA-092794 TaxID=3239929 RepID=UPI003D8A7EC3
MAAATVAAQVWSALTISPLAAATTSPPAVVTAARDTVPLPVGRSYVVTLLTGDVVTLTGTTGRCPQVSVHPARPGRVVSKSCGPDGHVRVVPADSAGLLGRTLDPALFDATELVQNGYDDAHTAELPLIVAYAAGHASTRFGEGLHQQRRLPILGGVAGRRPKRSSGAERSRSDGSVLDDLAGVSHVWLDRRLRASATDDTTAPPIGAAAGVADDLIDIGAPQAWSAGLTGQGVRVAVLDSGVDPTHPDLAGRIVASANFSTSTDTVDRNGHGTHVAATIAGMGAASHGVHRGVAPDAKLVIGKVLDDDGFGTDSQVIAGMEWAAPQASVVNLSLGGDFSDGTDPVSRAVDSLTAQYGTLFVVAAGNSGPGSGTISTPAAAASALAVGAVDSTGTLAEFSGRGPVSGTRRLKPEIVAPGVDIVSARAAGTSIGEVVDRYHTRLSGTSMAAPHVAGAAAILRQRYPNWAPDRLKAALTGAARPARGGDLYEQGAGQLFIPPALSDVVGGTAVADLSTFSYPQSGTTTGTVSWVNTGGKAMTLQLSLSVTDRTGLTTPDGSVALSANTVTLPAGQQRSVSITADRAAFAAHPDDYEGVLTARADGTVLRTPVVFSVEPASYELTVRATALPSTPDGALAWYATVANLDDSGRFSETVFSAVGTDRTVQVPAGRYSVLGNVFDATPSAPRIALAGTAEVDVAGTTTVLLDGARAQPVTAQVTGVETQAQQVGISALQGARVGGLFQWQETVAWGTSAAGWPVYSTPIAAVDVGFLHTAEVFSLRSPTAGPSPFMYDLVRTLPGSVPADPSYTIDPAAKTKLARLDERFNQLDLPGTHTGHNRKGGQSDGVWVSENDSDEVPANRVDYLTPGVTWTEETTINTASELGPLLLTKDVPRVYPAASRQRRDGFRQPLRPDWFDAPGGNGCAPQPVARTRGNLHVDLVALTDQHQRYNCLATFWPGSQPTLTLYRDGHQIATASGFTADFAVPADTGTYRLVQLQDNSAILPISTRVSTAWTFRSTGPTGEHSAPVPLFSLDYTLPLDTDNHPVTGPAAFTVRQASSLPTEHITTLHLWTSTDDGTTWRPATVSRASADTFTAHLPIPAPGQPLSLRVAATGSTGSTIDQTIIRAYRAP